MMVPGGRVAAVALAQHLGVVDLAQLDVPARRRRPTARAMPPSARTRSGDRPSSSRKRARPRRRRRDERSARRSGDSCSSDGELAIAASGRAGARSIEQEAVRQHGDPQRCGQRGRRTVICTIRPSVAPIAGWPGGIQHHRARRRLAARANSVSEPCLRRRAVPTSQATHRGLSAQFRYTAGRLMRAVDIIIKKRDGGTLARDEIRVLRRRRDRAARCPTTRRRRC